MSKRMKSPLPGYPPLALCMCDNQGTPLPTFSFPDLLRAMQVHLSRVVSESLLLFSEGAFELLGWIMWSRAPGPTVCPSPWVSEQRVVCPPLGGPACLVTRCVSPHREEYGKLFDFVNAKKLNIKNRGLKEVPLCVERMSLCRSFCSGERGRDYFQLFHSLFSSYPYRKKRCV